MIIWKRTKFLKYAIVTVMIAAMLPACTSTTSSRTGIFSQKLVSETKEVSTKPLSMTITQKPTLEMPVMKFTIANPNIDYTIKKYQKLEDVKYTTTKNPLFLEGIATGALGLLYIFANASPDPAKYNEDKYNSLSDKKLVARQMGFVITLG
ncbi:MAG: hypothetical protein V1701_10735, partial [Planctomycetota bacterium]